MERKKIEKTILTDGRRCTHFSDNRYRWGDVVQILKDEHITLQDDDILEVGYTEGYDHGDSSRDAYYDLKVIRVRDETDEEFNKRIAHNKRKLEAQRNRRYDEYLKLKKEFDTNESV